MPDKPHEWIALIALAVCILVILWEYIWLSTLARRQETERGRRKEDAARIRDALETILYSPTEEARQRETAALAEYVGDDDGRMDSLSDRMLEMVVDPEIAAAPKEALVAVNDAVRPARYYLEQLRGRDVYRQAYACRKVAAYGEGEALPTVRKLSESRNPRLAYNAAMALALFGDEEGVAGVAARMQKNHDYSFRILVEMFDSYTGDLEALARRILADCDDYIRANVIKAVGRMERPSFVPVYLEGLRSRNANLRVACVTALGQLADRRYEHELITAAHDKEWMVRSAAVKQLGRLDSDEVRQALAQATTDPEWWVRYNAARSLVQCDGDLAYVEKVLGGYDKYGADVTKYMLYRAYDLKDAGEGGARA